MTKNGASEQSKGWIATVRSWSLKQWLVGLGVPGLPLAILVGVVTYYATLHKPALTFAVNPSEAELRRPDLETDFGFTFQGKPIPSESVTAVQVAVWNDGSQEIWDRDVLQQVQLVTPPGVAIISARIKKVSRPECKFERVENSKDFASGICRLNWHILEPGDGAVVQLILAGTAQQSPVLQGSVAGQPKPFELKYEHSTVAKIGKPETFWYALLVNVIGPLLEGALPLGVGIWAANNIGTEGPYNRKKTALIFGVATVASFFLFIIGYHLIASYLLSAGPQFGW